VFAELLRQQLGSIIELSPKQIIQLERHYELLIRWNRVLSLTSVVKLEEIVERHYCESLFLTARLPAGRLCIADVGAGAGFPGIPIAVARPDCSISLIESHRRKCVFLREATREMDNIRVIEGRAEDVPERFDWAVSRAVRYSKIEKLLSSLGENAALLAGEEGPSNTCFTWNTPIQLPWGKRRYLWLGRAVPRETR
jgi:16S rRNA (guanine527-N7)-methyltransferase